MNKPKTPQPETPGEIQERDSFQTPKYATRLLVPFLKGHVSSVSDLWRSLTVWECAEGAGRMQSVLAESFICWGTDLLTGVNFLTDPAPREFDMIVTNPPFSLKKKFYKRCLSYGKPFALLIPADYSGWIIEAVHELGCEKIVPTRRIDYITPTGKNGKASAAQFHSMWLTWGLGLGSPEVKVELTKEMKLDI